MSQNGNNVVYDSNNDSDHHNHTNNNNNMVHDTKKTIPVIETVPVISTNSLPAGSRSCGSSAKVGDPESNGSNSINGLTNTITTNNIGEKIYSLKNWSVKQYKCKKQSVEEKIWKECKTIDEDCDKEIGALKELQHKYGCILDMVENSVQQFVKFLSYQHVLAEQFQQLSLLEVPNLRDDLEVTGEIQKTVGNTSTVYLIEALRHFTSSLHTLVHRTFEDTLLTVQKFEQCRLEYDATRNAAERHAATFQAKLKNNTAASSDPLGEARQQKLHQDVLAQREIYQQFKSDVLVKKRLLEENRVRVIQRELRLFNNAIVAYFGGNHNALETLFKAHNASEHKPTNCQEGSSFLEHNGQQF